MSLCYCLFATGAKNESIPISYAAILRFHFFWPCKGFSHLEIIHPRILGNLTSYKLELEITSCSIKETPTKSHKGAAHLKMALATNNAMQRNVMAIDLEFFRNECGGSFKRCMHAHTKYQLIRKRGEQRLLLYWNGTSISIDNADAILHSPNASFWQ